MLHLKDTGTLRKHILSRVDMDEDEVNHFLSHFTTAKFKKKQFVIQPNFVAKHRIYVVNGALRSFVFNENGQDFTINFAIDDWWISDFNSYIFQQPATLFVEALADSSVLLLSFENEQLLKKANHKYETYFRIIAEGGLAQHQRRVITNLSKSAEERYREFEEKYPQISQKVPQYALASFLGMTTEYLSKVRNKLSSKKN